MGELPSGAVTFLFTDVEGSTRLLHELGPDRYSEALAEHRRLVRDAFARHGGVEVDTQGDAFFVAFQDAAAAAAAGLAVQEALGATPVRVRIGIHTGEPKLAEEGYVGMDVHKGARIAAAGHGGQIVLSQATRERLADGSVRDLGEHRVKDFAEPVWLFQLGDGSFPPLKTISNTNLPRPASEFIGREREVEEVVSLLRDGARLLTLTGPGGSGKTRLAIEAASELVGDVLHGVFWIGLATIREPELVLPTVAQTLGAPDELAAHVGGREMLLLLDNLEQVVEVAPEVATLVEACPQLTVLVTSREVMRVRGEVEYPVLPLADPDAVALFCARARLPESPAIEELCRRLDNMPLALELAAARTAVLAPEDILERLSQRLDLFRGGRDADPRQQTLRATIEWSHDLCSAEEQELFRRLGVFAGGATLAAVEAICGGELDTLQALVDKSLVRRSGERFWMLETIREFAAERLEASGERGELHRRHAEYLVDMAEPPDLDAHSFDNEQVAFGRTERENIRAALEWAIETDTRELGLRLATALDSYFPTVPLEGMRWFEQLLGDQVDLPLELRARALRAYGGCANPGGDDALAERLYEQSHALFKELGDERAANHLAMRLGHAALYRRDWTRARELGEASLSGAREYDDRKTESQSLGLLGEVDYSEGNRERGMRLLRESAALAAESGFTWWRTAMLGKLVDHELELGLVEDAAVHAREALALASEQGDRLRTVRALARLATIHAERGAREVAGRAWGAVEAEEQRGRIGAWENERGRFAERVLAHADAEFERGRRAGRALDLETAVAGALSRA